MLEIVPVPSDLVMNVTSAYESVDHRTFVEISGKLGLEETPERETPTFYVRLGGYTRPMAVQIDENSLQKGAFEIQRGLVPDVYEVTISADGGETFYPNPAMTFEILECPAGASCQ